MTCPVCGKPAVLYWLHTRAQFPNIPGAKPDAKIRLLDKQHPAALPVYGCQPCGIYTKPGPKTEGGAADQWRRKNFA
jgi:hypothetical protein